MRDKLFADPWLDARPGGAERERGLRSAPPPPDRLSGTENAGRRGLSSPPDPAPSRAPTRSAALPVGSLLYLVLVGLIAAATIAVFFGAGFLLLVHPEKEIVADTGTRDPPRPYGGTARTDLEDSPAPRASAAPDSAAITAPPGSPPAQPEAMAEVPPPQSEAAENSPPGASSSHPPARTALEPQPASGFPGSSASAMPLARPAPFSVADVPAPHATKSRATRDGRSHQSQTASRHRHPRSGHSAPTLTPPQAAQTGPFDRLLAVLTGRSGSLTPPRAQ
jgi:pyruvate/2-oxoglutarate dehydrogenase complex dihydrolipoamide acyltransferase (E2) component